MKLFCLNFDTDNTGSREEWNTFYTPLEVYSKDELREIRVEELKIVNKDYVFHRTTVTIDTPST
jgi:hypothetical protein